MALIKKISAITGKIWRRYLKLHIVWRVVIAVFVAFLLIGSFAEPSPEYKQQQAVKAQQEANAAKKLEQDKAAEAASKKAEADKAAAAKAEQETKEKNIFVDNDKYTLKSMSKTGIESVLKAPSTAKFQGGWVDPYDGWIFTYPKENVAVVNSTVDSENSFGAMIRSNFTIFYCKSEGKISIMHYVFEGEQSPENATACTL